MEFGADDVANGTTIVASLANGDPLPSWLSFNANTLRFAGVAPEGSDPSVELRVTFTNAAGASFSDTFVANSAALATGVVYDSDVALFDMSRGHFEAARANGRALPDWLTFDAPPAASR